MVYQDFDLESFYPGIDQIATAENMCINYKT